MNSISSRSFNCKDEELPILCGFLATSLTRDMSDFTAYSPMFDAPYLADYQSKIELVQELVQPKWETVELKLITERTYSALDSLISSINHLEGYLNLADEQVPISSTDFGLVQLRKSSRSRDVENVIKQLRTVNANLKKYKTDLMDKGLTDALIAKFTDALTMLSEEKNKRYALVSNRTALVQNNLGQLNELYDQLSEICKIGKILYKQNDPAKLKDYSFTQLMKQVRRAEKKVEEKQDEQPDPEAN